MDQGSSFDQTFVDIARISGVEVDKTGIEAHSSLGLGERYHQPLRKTYRKIIAQYPHEDRNFVLAISVKAMNDTLGPEGLVPSALVFGEFPKFVTKSEVPRERSILESRAEMATLVRKEM